jgi:hypothetical protein
VRGRGRGRESGVVRLSLRLGEGYWRSLTALPGSRPDWGSTPVERVVPPGQVRVAGELRVGSPEGRWESGVPGQVGSHAGGRAGPSRETRME